MSSSQMWLTLFIQHATFEQSAAPETECHPDARAKEEARIAIGKGRSTGWPFGKAPDRRREDNDENS
jgi:hypothetical protein